jgi:hypothetical protein
MRGERTPALLVSEDKFGWSVRDRTQGEHPNNVRAAYVAFCGRAA